MSWYIQYLLAIGCATIGATHCARKLYLYIMMEKLIVSKLIIIIQDTLRLLGIILIADS